MSQLIARAPARLDFGGGWTDVPPYDRERGGCVCNIAVQLHAVATVSSAANVAPGNEQDNALVAAAARRAGLEQLGVSLTTDYPHGAGLGGSSAAGVAVVGALAAWRGVPLDGIELAEESRRLEVSDLGVAGGRQDHYAAALGGALGLRFGDRVTVQRIPLADATVQALDLRCLVAYTGQSRLSAETITAVLDAYRAREQRVVTALDRMRDLAGLMIAALERGDVDDLGQLVGEHWVHQRSLHPAIPTPLIDTILAAAGEAGALGGKALGASGGGCVMAIARADRVEDVRRAMGSRAMLLATPVEPRGFEVVQRREPASSALAGWAP